MSRLQQLASGFLLSVVRLFSQSLLTSLVAYVAGK